MVRWVGFRDGLYQFRKSLISPAYFWVRADATPRAPHALVLSMHSCSQARARSCTTLPRTRALMPRPRAHAPTRPRAHAPTRPRPRRPATPRAHAVHALHLRLDPELAHCSCSAPTNPPGATRPCALAPSHPRPHAPRSASTLPPQCSRARALTLRA